MKTNIQGLLTVIITMLGFAASAQQIQPNPNPLIMPAYTPRATPTPTVTPNAPYTNPQGGSTTPYTTGPLKQQTGPPPTANPPPLTPPRDTMRARTIIEPAHQPIPPPL